MSAGMALCFFLAQAAFAQTTIKQNPDATQDSITLDLPHKTKMILILDDVNDLKYLEETSLDSVVRGLNKQLQSSLPTTGNKLKPESEQKPQQGDARYDLGISRKNDQLVLNIGPGIGFVRNQFVPKLALMAAILSKGKEFSLTYDMNYFFERSEKRDYKLFLNSFVEFGLGVKTLQKGTGIEMLQKVTIGYLVQSSGDYFGKNTFKVSYTYPLLKRAIKVVPELYITDNFGSVFPGISIIF